jgi:hypothetical protein
MLASDTVFETSFDDLGHAQQYWLQVTRYDWDYRSGQSSAWVAMISPLH